LMEDTVLIIDDDARLNELLTRYLADFGFRVLSATHPERGLEIFREAAPKLVILDIMLPGMDGFEVCKTIRRGSRTPVIMLTARGELTDRVVGLELGADDYMPKPFEPRELAARMQSVLRRTRAAQPEADPKQEKVRRFGRLVIDVPRMKATVDGKPVKLTANEFAALALLAAHPGEPLHRDRLLEELRGMESDAYNRAVDITMSRLRQKLGDNPKFPEFIKTVWGTGYVFIGSQNADAAD